MYLDLPEPALHAYRSALQRPEDFDDFWTDTLTSLRRRPLDLELAAATTPIRTLDTFDVTFTGWGGTRVKGWLTVPTRAGAPLPVVVEYLGYGGGRGLPTEHLLWASAGFAHLVMDSRGQGSGWAVGATADDHGTGPSSPGMLTRGIESPAGYYYRRLTADAVRAVEAARSLPSVDPEKTVVIGTSQGGGLALAVGGLVPDLASVVARVPFLCDIARAITITDSDPYHEIVRYLAAHRDQEEQALRTLSYFDNVNHAARGTSTLSASAALMDPICPPSTVFGAFNAWAGPKAIRVYRYNGHEGGGVHEDAHLLDELSALLS